MGHTNHNSKGINSLTWLTKGEILLLRVETPLGADTVIYDQMIMGQLDETSHPVHVVIQVSELPLDDSSLEDLTQLRALRHPRLGCIALVGEVPSPMLNLFAAMMSGLKGGNFKMFSQLDEAVKYLNRAKMKYLTVPSQFTDSYAR
jgi:hypothetical protein